MEKEEKDEEWERYWRKRDKKNASDGFGREKWEMK